MIKSFLVLLFTFTACSVFAHCSPPTSLSVTAPNCSTLVFDWTGNGCNPSYELQYKRNNGSWTVVNTANTDYTATGLVQGTYFWKVRTKCSPNVYSSFVDGAQQSLSCRLGEEKNETGITDVEVFPNPTSGQLTLRLIGNTNEQQTELRLFTALGETVFEKTNSVASGEIDLDFSGLLNDGIYILQLKIDNNSFYKPILVHGK